MKKRTYMTVGAAAGILFLLSVSLCIYSVRKRDAALLENFHRAKEAYAKGERERSAGILEAILQKNSSFEEAGFLLGKLRYYEKNFSESHKLMLSLHHHPEKDLWTAKSGIFLNKDAQLMISYLKKHLSVHPESAEALFLLGMLHEKQDQTENALKAYDSAFSSIQEQIQILDRLIGIYQKASMPEKTAIYENLKRSLSEFKKSRQGGV
ncbi:MAG TPA: hypothetical protein PL048_21020 [Leptospiraceae bacterium]|nr:hypothetical protein [Leptospiraceae bacterium]HMZ61268.1 hypothetical protein [Leptospiraceae bacterium]HNF12423.1 hypothetical protein [Leptospiraceae bacterium]HNF27141.1 hypothetical protein [Leptospiraceae bacterium]HNI27824.1 hypothetical protein [Leptospiraceae bacterium]